MKIKTIIKKEYMQIVKKKSFIISTILTPLLMGAFIFIPFLLTKVGREVKTIEILDYSGLIQEEFLARSLNNKRVSDSLKLKFFGIEEKNQKQKELIEDYLEKVGHQENVNLELLTDYRNKILEKKINGLILIPENLKESRRFYYCSLNVSDFATNQYIQSTIQKILSEKILTEHDIDIQIVQEAIKDIHLGTFKVEKEKITQTTSHMAYMLSIFMLTILFTIILAYGQLIMRGVIEEKNNRIIEVLISSTNTSTLFYGKIIGIGMAGLTQLGIWILMAAFFLKQSIIGGIDKGMISFFSLELAIYFIVFFIIGYFMYSVLFSIVGASVNTDQEAQQFSTPITYLLIIPFILGIFVTQNPDTPLVILTSFFPLFTPTLMFMRISVAVPPMFQIYLGIISSIAFTVLLAWFGAKIFRVGILMYGKKPTVSEILKWIRYK